MFFMPKVITQPTEVPRSTLSLKLKITQKLFEGKKAIPEDKPGLMFQYQELQEKWEMLETPPEKANLLEFLSGIESLVDRLIGQNDTKNIPLIEKFTNFKEECIVLGIPYFGPTLTNDLRAYLETKNYQIGMY